MAHAYLRRLLDTKSELPLVARQATSNFSEIVIIILKSLRVVFAADDVVELGRRDVAALAEETRPKLDPDDAEDEEDEEAEQEDVSQHGEGVEQKHHKDSHAWKTSNRKFGGGIAQR